MDRSIRAAAIAAVLASALTAALVWAAASTRSEREIEAIVDRRVEARLWEASRQMNDGMGVETTSTSGTFWWVGYRLRRDSETLFRVNNAWEQSFHDHPAAAAPFKFVHQAIDDKPDWHEPYLAYTEDPSWPTSGTVVGQRP